LEIKVFRQSDVLQYGMKRIASDLLLTQDEAQTGENRPNLVLTAFCYIACYMLPILSLNY